ncbi:MAG: PEP-CTERM sorting domain-containing protein, partial [Pseudomonadota bacterium]
SNFTLAPAFVTFLGDNGVDPATMTFVATMIKEIRIGTVSTPAIPEPSTYALMGLGLVGMSLVARRRQAQ